MTDDRIFVLKGNLNTCDKTGFLIVKTDQAGEHEITYADPTFCKRAEQKQVRLCVMCVHLMIDHKHNNNNAGDV